MKYQRKEDRNGYEIVTTVDDAGTYEQNAIWKDGVITSRYKTTLQKMGWNSTKEFLRDKKGFKKVTV